MVRQHGMSLPGVLVVVTLVALIASSMTLLYMANLQLSLSSNNGEIAHNEAEAALQETLARIIYDPAFGSLGTETVEGTSTPGMNPQEAWHRLSFAAGPVRQSLYGPDESLVYAVGYCKGQYRTVEAVIRPSEYSYALATDGPILSTTSFTAQGVSDPTQPGRTDRPGNVVTNSHVDLRGTVDISGRLRAAGTVTLPNNSRVNGGVERGVAQRSLPRLELADLDALLSVPNLPFPPTPVIADAIPTPLFKASSAYRRDGDLSFAGAVEMQHGALRVAKPATAPGGNLHFQGALRGEGLVVCDGNITVANADMAGSGQITLVAGGNVTIQSGFFRGLIYSQCGFKLVQGSVLGGTVVSRGASTPPGATLGAEVENGSISSAPNMYKETITINSVKNVKQGATDSPFFVSGMRDANGNLPVGDAMAQAVVPLVQQAISSGNLATLELDPDQPVQPDARPLVDALAALRANLQLLNAARQARDDAAAEIDRISNEIPPGNTSGAEASKAAAEAEISRLTTLCQQQAASLATDCANYFQSHATADGSLENKGDAQQPVTVTLDLYRFLARSEAVRVLYYKEHAQLLR